MNWHKFETSYPQNDRRVIITDGTCVACAIWRNGLTNVMGLKGGLPPYDSFTHWISVEEMLEKL